MNTGFIFTKLYQFLGVLVADGQDHPTPDGQLFNQQLGNFRRTGRDDDRIKRAFVRPSGRTVRILGADVVVAKPIK